MSAIAAIDLGSHSSRLLIERDGTTLVREVELTTMGEGLADTAALTAEAIDRVVAATEGFAARCGEHNVERVRIGATAAAREASNATVLLDRVEAVIGTRPQVLDAATEAELSFRGATAAFDAAQGPFLVVDIGGASTEFAFGVDSCEGSISLDIGSVRLSDMYLDSDPPAPDELSSAVTVTGAWLDDVDRDLPQARDAAMVIGVGGTVATAVAVEVGLSQYDRDVIHHFALTSEAAEDVFRTLATENREDRAWNPGLPPGRVDTIVGGMCILVKVMRHFGLDTMTASESDILDGLAWSIR